MSVINDPRRIAELSNINKLNETGENLLDSFQLPASSTAPDTEAKKKASPAKWFVAADYKKNTSVADGDAWTDEGQYDYGSVNIPISRIALRDANGLIPSSMLPSYVDDIIFGTLTYTSGTKTQFVENVSGKIYVSPPSARTGHSTYLEPPENVVFNDTTSNIQYRFIKTSETDNNAKYGFAEVPGSRAINRDGYGLNIDDIGNSIKIEAKKADYYSATTASTFVTVDSTESNIPLSTASSTNVGLGATVSSDRLTKVTNLIEDARYVMHLQLECSAITLSGNIIDVTVKCGSFAVLKRQMDMSGPNNSSSNQPSITQLDFTCEFKNGASNELVIKIASEEPIKVKTTRFTVFELL